jgi:hypothetical protein
MYSGGDELARIAGNFLAEGLRRSERCWYLPASDDPATLRAALRACHIDATRAEERGALNILSSGAAYSVRGTFDPEETMAVFSNAIEQALADGFNGFRAAANMSWALDLDGGAELLITYEALLRSLFSSARATGLCLYDRQRMPLAVIDGALATHPIVHAHGVYSPNGFYDAGVRSLRAVEPATVKSRLERLHPEPNDAPHPSGQPNDRSRTS